MQTEIDHQHLAATQPLDCIQHTGAGVWTVQQLDYLISNAGRFQLTNIAAVVGKSTGSTRQKFQELGLNPEFTGLPEALDDLLCIPDGMIIRTTKTAHIYRVPTSTPGIPTRTIHVPLGSWDENED